MAEPGGLSSEDFRKRASVASISRTTGATLPDPMDEAFKTARQVAAINSIKSIQHETTNARLMAETEGLKAELENERLKAERAELASKKPGAEAAPSEFMTFLLAKVESLSGEVRDAEKARNEERQEALKSQLVLVMEEIDRLRNQEQPDPMTNFVTAYEKAVQLVELVRPTTKEVAVPPPPGNDGALEAWKMRAEIEQERWRAERQDRFQIQMAEIEAKNALERERLQLEKERLESVDRAITTSLPRLLDLGEQFMSRFATPAPPPVAAGFTAGGATAAAAPPPGALMGECQGDGERRGCGTTFSYFPHWKQVGCPGCGALYELTPDQDEAPEKSRPWESGGWEQHSDFEQEREAERVAVPFV